MKIAIPIWQGRVSPVFDVAGQLMLVDVADGTPAECETITIGDVHAKARAEHLTERKVDVLICGALSRPLELMLARAGLEVVPWICGEVERVLDAYVRGNLVANEFLMPGCCGRRNAHRIRDKVRDKEVSIMPRGNGMGPPAGGGRGRGAAGRGRMGGPAAAGPGGECICPQCGAKKAHVPGQPCNQQTCPKCGVPLTRT